MDDIKANVFIVGTSHISTRSARDIRKAFDEFQPDIVAVELDVRRLQSLKEMAAGGEHRRPPLSMIRHVGVTGYLFLVIGGWLQRKLAGIIKVMPGIDMLAAIELTAKNGKRLALVDQDVLVTTRKLSKAFDWRHKFRLLWDVISGPFQQKHKMNVPLHKVPDARTIKKLMGILKERYPALYKVIVEDRNVVMAANLDKIARAQPGVKILLVIGAGHEEGLRRMLKASKIFSLAD